MDYLRDSKGKPVKLKAGHCAGFNFECQCLTLMVEETGEMMRWSGSDNKKLMRFIHTEFDFLDLLVILAETHGLLLKQSERLLYGRPMYVFFNH